jgi:D-glycero-alpha-D-manno-heptose-7-phosphate kinase
LYALHGRRVSKESMAAEAVMVEQQLIGERVGVQDQYAAAFGGLNFMEFSRDGSVAVNPVPVSRERKKELMGSLMLFYTTTQRFAHNVVEEQLKKTQSGSVDVELATMRKMVDKGIGILSSEESLEAFGELLHEAWINKKKLSSSVSNNNLDDIYETARKAGARGGKLLGAGGGGFFLFYVDKENQESVRRALSYCPEVTFEFESEGSRIIFLH